MLDADVDGIEFRIENHSHMTDHAFDYGFNDAVLALAGENASDEVVAKVRGDAYTEFFRKASAMIRARGKISRHYISIDRITEPLPPDRLLAWPQNVEYQWERWLEEGLIDETVFRVFNFEMCKTALQNPLTEKVAVKCQECNVPMVFSFYVRSVTDPWYIEEVKRILNDGRFAGISLYENSSIYELAENNTWQAKSGGEEFIRQVKELAALIIG